MLPFDFADVVTELYILTNDERNDYIGIRFSSSTTYILFNNLKKKTIIFFRLILTLRHTSTVTVHQTILSLLLQFFPSYVCECDQELIYSAMNNSILTSCTNRLKNIVT